MRIIEQARIYREIIEKAVVSLPDQDALNGVELFPAWQTDKAYTTGERVKYNHVLYKVLQNHTSQADWTPDVAASLFVRVDDPSIEWPEWIQPTGSTDAYAKGAKVSHNNKHWISLIDSNVWEPGAVGTESLWEEVA